MLITATALLIAFGLAIGGLAYEADVAERHRHLDWWWTGSSVGLSLGVAVGLVRRLFEGPRYPRRAALTRLPTALLALGVPVALVAVLLGAPAAGLVAGLSVSLSATLMAGGTHAGGDDHRGLSPAALLLNDRSSAIVAAVVSLIAPALIAMAWGIPEDMTAYDLTLSSVFVLPLPVAAVISGAWGQLWLARLALAACRRLPLRLMGFLSEAHDRGVLRQAGGIYQFRHNLLQDHLAAPTAPAAPAVL